MRALELGGGQQQREAVAVDEAEAAAVAHRDLERGDALGHVGAGGVHGERAARARRAGRRRRRR